MIYSIIVGFKNHLQINFCLQLKSAVVQIGKASSCMDEVKMEVDIMKKLRHNNVLRLYEGTLG